MKLTGAKTLMAEQRTTIDKQSGEKMPTEDKKNTLAEPMALNTTGAEQLGLKTPSAELRTTTADQVELEITMVVQVDLSEQEITMVELKISKVEPKTTRAEQTKLTLGRLAGLRPSGVLADRRASRVPPCLPTSGVLAE